MSPEILPQNRGGLSNAHLSSMHLAAIYIEEHGDIPVDQAVENELCMGCFRISPEMASVIRWGLALYYDTQYSQAALRSIQTEELTWSHWELIQMTALYVVVHGSKPLVEAVEEEETLCGFRIDFDLALMIATGYSIVDELADGRRRPKLEP
ncbi:hypothetical protein JW766_00150 [Candidatus Dojkabacteria bacterium]|nr:hypothetical protein [Candidatus Dojkabacteria bacterium]